MQHKLNEHFETDKVKENNIGLTNHIAGFIIYPIKLVGSTYSEQRRYLWKI